LSLKSDLTVCQLMGLNEDSSQYTPHESTDQYEGIPDNVAGHTPRISWIFPRTVTEGTIIRYAHRYMGERDKEAPLQTRLENNRVLEYP